MNFRYITKKLFGLNSVFKSYSKQKILSFITEYFETFNSPDNIIYPEKITRFTLVTYIWLVFRELQVVCKTFHR